LANALAQGAGKGAGPAALNLSRELAKLSLGLWSRKPQTGPFFGGFDFRPELFLVSGLYKIMPKRQ
jgi:hypothetical protein